MLETLGRMNLRRRLGEVMTMDLSGSLLVRKKMVDLVEVIVRACADYWALGCNLAATSAMAQREQSVGPDKLDDQVVAGDLEGLSRTGDEPLLPHP